MILSLSAVLLVLRLVSATPFTWPLEESHYKEVAAIGVDEENAQYVAYRRDGSLYGRFSANNTPSALQRRTTNPASCNQISISDVEKLPGYDKLYKYAVDTYGSGWDTMVTNDPEFPNEAAVACADSAPVNLNLTGHTCDSSTGSSNGTMTNTSAIYRFVIRDGTEGTLVGTVMKENSIGWNADVRVNFEFNPKIFSVDVGAGLGTSVLITNRQTQSFQSTINTINSRELWMTNPPNRTCYTLFTSNSCTLGGTGQVNTTVSGTVVVKYPKPVKGHYVWLLHMEVIIPNPDDRTTSMTILASVRGDSQTNFVGICDGSTPLKPTPPTNATQH